MCIIHQPTRSNNETGGTLTSVRGQEISGNPNLDSAEPSAVPNSSIKADCEEGRGGDTQTELGASCPLIIFVDGQDFTKFHVCLSSCGVLTVLDGLYYSPTLLPVDVISLQTLTFQRRLWDEEAGRDKSKTPSFSTLHLNTCTNVCLEFGAAASRVSPSHWSCLINSDCLVSAVSLCEKQRLQMAVDLHQSKRNQVASSQKSAATSLELCLTEDLESGCAFQECMSVPLKSKALCDEPKTLLLSDSNYLVETIIPVLYPALEAVLRDRPEDPLAFLAFYLLRHATGYSRTSFATEAEDDDCSRTQQSA